MTYTLRGIPDKLWYQIQENARMSGITVAKYILLTLEHHNVQFNIEKGKHPLENSRKNQLEVGGKAEISEVESGSLRDA